MTPLLVSRRAFIVSIAACIFWFSRDPVFDVSDSFPKGVELGNLGLFYVAVALHHFEGSTIFTAFGAAGSAPKCRLALASLISSRGNWVAPQSWSSPKSFGKWLYLEGSAWFTSSRKQSFDQSLMNWSHLLPRIRSATMSDRSQRRRLQISSFQSFEIYSFCLSLTQISY